MDAEREAKLCDSIRDLGRALLSEQDEVAFLRRKVRALERDRAEIRDLAVEGLAAFNHKRLDHKEPWKLVGAALDRAVRHPEIALVFDEFHSLQPWQMALVVGVDLANPARVTFVTTARSHGKRATLQILDETTW